MAATEPSVSSVFAAKLDEKRRRLGLNNRDFAAYLTAHGVTCSQAFWSRVRRGERGVSNGFALGVSRLWPEFWGYHNADLLGQRGLRAAG